MKVAPGPVAADDAELAVLALLVLAGDGGDHLLGVGAGGEQVAARRPRYAQVGHRLGGDRADPGPGGRDRGADRQELGGDGHPELRAVH